MQEPVLDVLRAFQRYLKWFTLALVSGTSNAADILFPDFDPQRHFRYALTRTYLTLKLLITLQTQLVNLERCQKTKYYFVLILFGDTHLFGEHFISQMTIVCIS